MTNELTPQEKAKQLKKIAIIDTPGSILIGLGLYGKFGANGNAFHPFLNSETNLNAMLVVGGIIWAYGLYRTLNITLKGKMQKKDPNVDEY